jgi:archaeal flagellar protein FlaJ
VILISLFNNISRWFPTLPEDLRKANIRTIAVDFVKKTFFSALYACLMFEFIIFVLLVKFIPIKDLCMLVFGSLPLFFAFLFFYFFQLPKVKISRIDREICKEIVFAGRFLIVELESGVPLYDAMKNIGKSYPITGAYFREIVDKINVGTPMEDAVSESIDLSPSPSLTKILWQISNSLRTGSDIASPLKSVVETLIKEQEIAVTEYSRKLNPLAMFYMMIAVIMPSLGVTMLTIVSIFAGIKLDLTILIIISLLIGFVQFMFVNMIKSIRPPVEL